MAHTTGPNFQVAAERLAVAIESLHDAQDAIDAVERIGLPMPTDTDGCIECVIGYCEEARAACLQEIEHAGTGQPR
jgi:hypothetical protein